MFNWIKEKYFKLVYGMDKETKVAEILYKVAKSNYYKEGSNVDNKHNEYMCLSLDIAYNNNFISNEEYWLSCDAISKYINYRPTLKIWLLNNGYPSDFEDRFNIYTNWKQRPKGKETLKY